MSPRDGRSLSRHWAAPSRLKASLRQVSHCPPDRYQPPQRTLLTCPPEWTNPPFSGGIDDCTPTALWRQPQALSIGTSRRFRRPHLFQVHLLPKSLENVVYMAKKRLQASYDGRLGAILTEPGRLLLSTSRGSASFPPLVNVAEYRRIGLYQHTVEY